MTDGYLSKDREHLAKLQRQRRARMVRIDYMPGKAARDAIEAMRAQSRPGSGSATNSAVIDAIVAEWARLTGLKKSGVDKPMTPAIRPGISDQYPRVRISSGELPSCGHARERGSETTPGIPPRVGDHYAQARARSSTETPEFWQHTQARACANNFGSLPAGPNQARVICGAKRRRDGQPCQGLSVPGKQRCKWHGGASTGPKTDEGRARSMMKLRQYRP